jgi:hypothetical protein
VKKQSYFLVSAWLAAVILTCIGFGWSSVTLRNIGELERQLERKRRYMEELEEMEKQLVPYIDARRAFNALEKPQPLELDSLVNSVDPDLDALIRQVERRPVDGWELLRKEVVVDSGRVSTIFELINEIESSGYVAQDGDVNLTRPSWRMIKASVSSLAGRPGWGRSVLVFESLSK